MLAAWESEKQVYFGRIDHRSRQLEGMTTAPGAGKNRKCPALAVNRKGEVLFAWKDSMAWGKGGTVAWQLYNQNLHAAAVAGKQTVSPPGVSWLPLNGLTGTSASSIERLRNFR